MTKKKKKKLRKGMGVENYHTRRGMMKMQMGTKLSTAMGKPMMKKPKMGKMSY